MITLINLKKGGTRELIHDAEFAYFLETHQVHEDTDGYPSTNIAGHKIPLHRIILPVEGKGFDIDHKNRNKWDCTRDNLRWYSRSENSRNKGLQANNNSGYRGVHHCKTRNTWVVQTKEGEVRRTLGRCDKVEDAIVMRMRWELENDLIPLCDTPFLEGLCKKAMSQEHNAKSEGNLLVDKLLQRL